ncbi:MAG: hypothetical protein Q9219_003367 [cf. Caloplaca sp. 3 TL-2023]
MATIATYRVPKVENENNVHYLKGSPERKGLEIALQSYQQPREIPDIVNGKEQEYLHAQGEAHDWRQIRAPGSTVQKNPSNHGTPVCRYNRPSGGTVSKAIDAALAAKPTWEAMPFADRAAVFLKAADLVSGKYRSEIMAATMAGQGKNAWQAEIDAAAELCDFFRFNVQYAQELYAQQPVHNSTGVWNRVEYRPLEGFVYAITPFNFTAIAGNLPGAPVLMGNVCVWKPSPSAIASNYLVWKILMEAGLPPNVIQFVPGDAEEVTNHILAHKDFAALHYTGSTAVFRQLFAKIASGVADGRYRGYPRIVGETGGKNYHLIHPSADVHNAAINTVRGAFEYQGQKCSATSRAYVPASLWQQFKSKLVQETKALKVGSPQSFDAFVGPVIHEASFRKLQTVIDDAKNDTKLELLAGGEYDDTYGYFIHPTIYQTTDPCHHLLSTELFGPVLTIYVYDDSTPAAFSDVCNLIDTTSDYALTGAVFARDRTVIREAENLLRNSAGNFYINCKSTGAVVGQQPFGGARASGTNDKAGSQNLLSRFVSMRSIKEDFVGSGEVKYPSNDV